MSPNDENKDRDFESLYIKDSHVAAGLVKSFRLNRDKLGAKIGLTNSLFNLGLRYEYGKDLPMNLAQALYCYNRAKEKGLKAAEERIAKLQAAHRLLVEERPDLLKPLF
ncbi:MAG: hypothetical protein LBE80_01780 [Deltaproteobacteria bacterium]|jgi:TPR repeat protein|nr:hypothetical protein [Deltaproteobacteria bacterium]